MHKTAMYAAIHENFERHISPDQPHSKIVSCFPEAAHNPGLTSDYAQLQKNQGFDAAASGTFTSSVLRTATGNPLSKFKACSN
jgi:hypothetical protein